MYERPQVHSKWACETPKVSLVITTPCGSWFPHYSLMTAQEGGASKRGNEISLSICKVDEFQKHWVHRINNVTRTQRHYFETRFWGQGPKTVSEFLMRFKQRQMNRGHSREWQRLPWAFSTCTFDASQGVSPCYKQQWHEDHRERTTSAVARMAFWAPMLCPSGILGCVLQSRLVPTILHSQIRKPQ